MNVPTYDIKVYRKFYKYHLRNTSYEVYIYKIYIYNIHVHVLNYNIYLITHLLNFKSTRFHQTRQLNDYSMAIFL